MSRRRPSTPAESLVERLDRSEPGTPGQDTVPSGFPSFDRRVGGGFRRRDLVVLTGDVGSGKSSLALGIALRSALLGTPTIYFSGEMSEERLLERALAVEGKATIDEIRGGKLTDPARSAVGAAAVRLRGLPLVIRGLHGLSFEALAESIRMIPRRGLVVIDPARLRPLDRLRLAEQLQENPELGWALDDLRQQFADMALMADTADMRESARLKYLAVGDVQAVLLARMAGFKLAHENEMAAERERVVTSEAA